jgi:hypothetical protein
LQVFPGFGVGRAHRVIPQGIGDRQDLTGQLDRRCGIVLSRRPVAADEDAERIECLDRRIGAEHEGTCALPGRLELQQEGMTITAEQLIHLSPTDWEHINLTGDYVWDLTVKSPHAVNPKIR